MIRKKQNRWVIKANKLQKMNKKALSKKPIPCETSVDLTSIMNDRVRKIQAMEVSVSKQRETGGGIFTPRNDRIIGLPVQSPNRTFVSQFGRADKVAERNERFKKREQSDAKEKAQQLHTKRLEMFDQEVKKHSKKYEGGDKLFEDLLQWKDDPESEEFIAALMQLDKKERERLFEMHMEA